MNNELKSTALTHVHEALGAKMVPFAGYNMPVQYNGLKLEHAAVREAVGMFDVSHMGEFFVEGPQALDFLQMVTTNDVSRLLPGKIQYSCMPNAQGGIVDDLLVYCFSAQHFMLVVNASNMEKDWNHLMHYAPQFDVELRNESDDYSLLAVQGPNAIPLLQTLTEIDLADIKYYSFTLGSMAGMNDVIISATGYTGAGGFELYVPNAVAETLWNAIMKAGSAFGLLPAGLGARDTLRLEMGMALYGNDIDDTTSPIEAGLSWITKFTKDFVSCELFQAQKEAGAVNKLVGFEMMERGIPRHDYPIADESGTVIGRVTSGTNSPSTGKNIGMGYVPTSLSKEGATFYVMIRNKPIKAQVVKLPFYKK
ncbi:glycine cleavage system aminomethyltransferase GcvT [Schleiferiaceae bacterium]|nr:glycine cleavage system aminomethyltransferase GcvT [Schleiferiaceae bacterium]MDC3346740.1 glycine cleavage system aminomethyltransferase GcvT [Schleiferiaceae bacterium]